MFSELSKGQGSEGDLEKEGDIQNYLKQTAGGQRAAGSIKIRQSLAM